MRRVILAFVTTVTGLVLLLSFKTHQAPVGTPLAAGGGTAGGTGGTGGSGTSGGSATGSGGSQTVTGDEAQTRYGPVQVQITVANGRITDVQTVEYPDGTPRDAEINQVAIPELDQEALAANSARIDMISGATYTSDGYVTSLQSAIDKAGLG